MVLAAHLDCWTIAFAASCENQRVGYACPSVVAMIRVVFCHAPVSGAFESRSRRARACSTPGVALLLGLALLARFGEVTAPSPSVICAFLSPQRSGSLGRIGRVDVLLSTKRKSESHERVRGYGKSTWLPRETHSTRAPPDKTSSSEADNQEDSDEPGEKLELGAEVSMKGCV